VVRSVRPAPPPPGESRALLPNPLEHPPPSSCSLTFRLDVAGFGRSLRRGGDGRFHPNRGWGWGGKLSSLTSSWIRKRQAATPPVLGNWSWRPGGGAPGGEGGGGGFSPLAFGRATALGRPVVRSASATEGKLHVLSIKAYC
jgi:hypothetical protein